MSINPNTKASQTLRSKRKAAGLQEVRGIWAPPSFHSMLKGMAANSVKGLTSADVATEIDGLATGWVAQCPRCLNVLHITRPPSDYDRLRAAGYPMKTRKQWLAEG